VSAPSPSFDSTDAIRQAVFEEWKAKRTERFKKELMEKQRKEKEIEEKKQHVGLNLSVEK
jgi:sugar diacid utilization regulator